MKHEGIAAREDHLADMNIFLDISERFLEIWFGIHCLACESPTVAKPAIHRAFGTHEKHAPIPMAPQQYGGNGDVSLTQRVIGTAVAIFHDRRYGLPPDGTNGVAGIDKMQVIARYLKGMTRNDFTQGF